MDQLIGVFIILQTLLTLTTAVRSTRHVSKRSNIQQTVIAILISQRFSNYSRFTTIRK